MTPWWATREAAFSFHPNSPPQPWWLLARSIALASHENSGVQDRYGRCFRWRPGRLKRKDEGGPIRSLESPCNLIGQWDFSWLTSSCFILSSFRELAIRIIFPNFGGFNHLPKSDGLTCYKASSVFNTGSQWATRYLEQSHHVMEKWRNLPNNKLERCLPHAAVL